MFERRLMGVRRGDPEVPQDYFEALIIQSKAYVVTIATPAKYSISTSARQALRGLESEAQDSDSQLADTIAAWAEAYYRKHLAKFKAAVFYIRRRAPKRLWFIYMYDADTAEALLYNTSESLLTGLWPSVTPPEIISRYIEHAQARTPGCLIPRTI